MAAGNVMAGLTMVTGAGRGLGRHMAERLAAAGVPLCLVCRHAADVVGMSATAPLHVVEADLAQPAQLAARLEQMLPPDAKIVRLINNAGCFSETEAEDFLALDDARAWEIAIVSGVAVALAVRAVATRMARAGIVVNILSDMAFARNWKGSYPFYCAAKAFALAFTVNAAPALLRHGVTMIGVDPGWMRTDMGGPDAPDDPAEIATGILALLERQQTLTAGAVYLAATGAEITVV